MLPKEIHSVEKKESMPFKVLKLLDRRFEEYVVVVGFLFFTLLITLQVINRYVLSFIEIGSISTWSEELARYTFIWIAYVGAALVIKKRGNINVDGIVRKLPVSWRQCLNLVGSLLTFALFYILIKGGIATTVMQVATNQVTPAMGAPMVYAYPVSYTHLRAHETRHDLVCRLLLEKKKNN